ncbi:MAG: Rpn family recombination-promoting nuclease/putative transposase [Treponema sp.]|jgi:predicted transposase/invertase (TIGR01784 family)|nr:Rpn family recombination-promoting nuclease/putative transposase [Treponema sp.]
MPADIRFDDVDDFIDICMDNVFKAVCARETPASQIALSRLVSAVIGREVSIIAITANEPPPNDTRDRQIRFDINCRAENGELVDVEMSLNPDPFEPVRIEFYAGKLFTGQELKGAEKNYNDLQRAFQITIIGKKSFFSDEDFYHCFEYYDPERRVTLDGKTRIITLELSKLERVVEKPTVEMSAAENWAVFFRYHKDKDKRRKIKEIIEREEGIAMASKVLMEISKDDAERARLLSEYKFQMDWQSKIVHAKREGRQEIIDLLRSGKSLDEAIQLTENK